MTISGYDCWKRKDLSRRWKLENFSAKTMSSGSPFQIRGPETLKVRLPTVDSRNIGTTRRLDLAERSARRPCRSATRSSGPRWQTDDRYTLRARRMQTLADWKSELSADVYIQTPVDANLRTTKEPCPVCCQGKIFKHRLRKVFLHAEIHSATQFMLATRTIYSDRPV